MLGKRIREFASDSGGATATLFGLVCVLLMITIGVAFDSARLYSISDKVRNALDASALAGAKLLDEDGATDADVANRVMAYFNTYKPQIEKANVTLGTPHVATNRPEYSVTVSADVTYDTAFGKLISVPFVKFAPSSTVVFKTKKIELAMVLDITGSMCEPGSQPCTTGPKISGLKTAAKDMIDVLVANSPEPQAVRVGLVPYSASVDIGSYYQAATNTPPGAQTCVIERNGSAGRNDDPPGSGNWFDPAPPGQCPSGSPLIPLQDVSVTTARNSLKAVIDAMEARMGTAGHLGLSWGWYSVSPNWSSFWPTASRPKPTSPEVLKAVLLMTDGVFNTSYTGGAAGAYNDDCNVNNSSCDLARAICDNMKADGITIFTVGFQAPAAAEVTLQYCASSTSHAFTADSASELAAAFRSVADRLSMLRLSR